MDCFRFALTLISINSFNPTSELPMISAPVLRQLVCVHPTLGFSSRAWTEESRKTEQFVSWSLVNAAKLAYSTALIKDSNNHRDTICDGSDNIGLWECASHHLACAIVPFCKSHVQRNLFGHMLGEVQNYRS